MPENTTNNKIVELLKQNNMTQKELSEATDITESAISRYVKGDRLPRGVNLIKLAQALRTAPECLIDEETNDIETIKALIARNAGNLTDNEKIEIITLLMGKNKEK